MLTTKIRINKKFVLYSLLLFFLAIFTSVENYGLRITYIIFGIALSLFSIPQKIIFDESKIIFPNNLLFNKSISYTQIKSIKVKEISTWERKPGEHYIFNIWDFLFYSLKYEAIIIIYNNNKTTLEINEHAYKNYCDIKKHLLRIEATYNLI